MPASARGGGWALEGPLLGVDHDFHQHKFDVTMAC
jgi:hypothetical protein